MSWVCKRYGLLNHHQAINANTRTRSATACSCNCKSKEPKPIFEILQTKKQSCKQQPPKGSFKKSYQTKIFQIKDILPGAVDNINSLHTKKTQRPQGPGRGCRSESPNCLKIGASHSLPEPVFKPGGIKPRGRKTLCSYRSVFIPKKMRGILYSLIFGCLKFIIFNANHLVL